MTSAKVDSTECPLTAEKYLVLLEAVSESLCQESEGVSWLVERTADLEAPEQRDTINAYFRIHRRRMAIEHAMTALRLLPALGHQDWYDESVNSYEIAVAAFDRALRDFERCFLRTDGSETKGADIAGRLGRIEVELARYRDLPEKVAQTLKKSVLRIEQSKRREYLEKLDKLTEKQADFYRIATSETKPLRGEALTAKSLHSHDSQAKAALAGLVKLGLFEKVQGGYRRVPVPGEKSQD